MEGMKLIARDQYVPFEIFPPPYFTWLKISAWLLKKEILGMVLGLIVPHTNNFLHIQATRSSASTGRVFDQCLKAARSNGMRYTLLD